MFFLGGWEVDFSLEYVIVGWKVHSIDNNPIENFECWKEKICFMYYLLIPTAKNRGVSFLSA